MVQHQIVAQFGIECDLTHRAVRCRQDRRALRRRDVDAVVANPYLPSFLPLCPKRKAQCHILRLGRPIQAGSPDPGDQIFGRSGRIGLGQVYEQARILVQRSRKNPGLQTVHLCLFRAVRKGHGDPQLRSVKKTEDTLILRCLLHGRLFFRQNPKAIAEPGIILLHKSILQGPFQHQIPPLL